MSQGGQVRRFGSRDALLETPRRPPNHAAWAGGVVGSMRYMFE